MTTLHQRTHQNLGFATDLSVTEIPKHVNRTYKGKERATDVTSHTSPSAIESRIQQTKRPNISPNSASTDTSANNNGTSTRSSSVSLPTSHPSFPRRSCLTSVGSESLLDHSHLKPGANASLLEYSQTITMYRDNAKKTRNADIQSNFAIFLIEAAKRLEGKDSVTDTNMRLSYLLEAESLLKKVASQGHTESQYHLANMHAAGLCSQHTKKPKPELHKAFCLFVQAAKHHHPDASYQAGKAYEEGIGTRRDKAKAVQFYRRAAVLNHPGAMYKLAMAQINGHLGLSRNLRDGHKWLKRSAEAATTEYPLALHVLGSLHEKGDGVVFPDPDYALSLYREACALGCAPSAYRLGECHASGELGCPQDHQRALDYYSLAAEKGHPEACFAMATYYISGVPGLLIASDEQAFEWVQKAADGEWPRAEYTLGYFYETGVGTRRDLKEAMVWYRKAADHGEKHALKRLQKSG
ncbi:hypothetical protein J3Q64DRAFT_1812304 [Phycomyces blakesleeanus]|uniref:HCP-like protein n=1 Tax=Phycomyces blakesleeanus TaxID=4837 RepID=A0ABR3BEL6_PHYBL